MKPALLWVASLVIGAGGLSITAPRALDAGADARTRADRLAQVRTLVGRIQEHQGQAEVAYETETSKASLTERLSACVTAAGLSKGVLSSVNPGRADTVAGPSPMVRERASVALDGLTLPELGRVLERWRASEPGWVVTGIDLSPQARPKAEPGADLPLRVNLQLEHLAAGDDQ